MSGRVRAALTTGSGVSLAVVGPGALAHVAAGGSLNLGSLGIVTLGAATAAALATAGAVRWTFQRLCLAALAAQPVLHFAFGSGHAGGHGGHAQHGAHASSAVAHADGRMVAAHLVVSLVAAVVIRWGLLWLRTLPALARALVLPAPRVSVRHVTRVRFAPAAPTPRRELTLLAARSSRGPPR